MPRIKIDDKVVLSFDYSYREIYWKELSAFLIGKYGTGLFGEHQIVESILLDSFQFMVDKFRGILTQETNFKFFLYVYWLHEESIKIYIKTLGGLKFQIVTETEFALYRRILKLILEQGCDNDLEWGRMPSGKEVFEMDEKIQHLLYLGNWIYGFSEHIAFQKMVEECHEVSIDEDGLLNIDWQYHYGEAYHHLFPELIEDYAKGTFDEKAAPELRNAIENCFGINYDFAFGIIDQIKAQLSNGNSSNLQTIEPRVLPLNLVNTGTISQENATLLYNGLTISRENKLSLEDAIYKPYSLKRYMFRPILIYHIGGEQRALIGHEKFPESIMVLATNAMHWNAFPEEWLKIKGMQAFMNKKGHEHDKILEDEIESIVKQNNLLYTRNIKSFKQPNKDNVRIDNELAGEIDFIIVDVVKKIIYVADAKYNRARYEAIGYRQDYTNFSDKYELQLERKVRWVSENLDILQKHLKIINNIDDLDLSDFEVMGIFLINTPTFYMFNGVYKAVTLNKLDGFLKGENYFPDIHLIKQNGDEEELIMARHPYFKKPLELPDLEQSSNI